MRFKVLKDFSHGGVSLKQGEYFYPKDVGFTKASLEFLEQKCKIYKISEIESPHEDVDETKQVVPMMVVMTQQPVETPVSTVNTVKNDVDLTEFKQLIKTFEGEEAVEKLEKSTKSEPKKETVVASKAYSRMNLKELTALATEKGLVVTSDMNKKDIIQFLKNMDAEENK